MLLHRYRDIDYILNLDVETGRALIRKAREQERDDRLRLQWTVQLPFMGEKNFISFPDYRDRCTGANIDTRSTAEILHEVDEVEKELKRGGS